MTCSGMVIALGGFSLSVQEDETLCAVEKYYTTSLIIIIKLNRNLHLIACLRIFSPH